MFHVTERLLLRPAWPEDWQEVLAGVADERVAMNLSRVPWPYGENDARWWTSQTQDPSLPTFLVIESQTGRIKGSIGLGEYHSEPEIGYWFAPNAWGRGYATEAGRGVIEVARMLGYSRLRAGHMTDNPASGRVLRKLGFHAVGTGSRFSLARNATVDSVEYALDLATGAAQRPCRRAA